LRILSYTEWSQSVYALGVDTQSVCTVIKIIKQHELEKKSSSRVHTHKHTHTHSLCFLSSSFLSFAICTDLSHVLSLFFYTYSRCPSQRSCSLPTTTWAMASASQWVQTFVFCSWYQALFSKLFTKGPHPEHCRKNS